MRERRKVLVVACALLVTVAVIAWIVAHGRTSSRAHPVQADTSEASAAAADRPAQATVPAPPTDQAQFTDVNAAELEMFTDMLLDRTPGAWSALGYTKIEDNEAFRTFLAGFEVDGSSIQLSPSQKERMVDSLVNWSLAFNQGSFAHFQTFRVPAAYTIRDDARQWQEYFLLNRAGLKAADLPEDPQQMWKLYWDKRNASESSFEGLWQAITVPKASVRRASRLPMTLANAQDLLEHRALCFGPGSVQFERGPEDVIKEEGTLLYADVEVVVSHRTGLTYPVVVRSFWDSTNEKWLPCEMIVCHTGKGRKADPDF